MNMHAVIMTSFSIYTREENKQIDEAIKICRFGKTNKSVGNEFTTSMEMFKVMRIVNIDINMNREINK